ncbi:hypothetical protein L6452_20139 [Arctium lappa]|uniref:Uncharacterized protein n=1 Tax=Arctium lappa TaxID=4217 RepID=A0ACB9BBF2_ARCLA|nr:hypothetical protein L6452_20139 [Arctium lappa]
MPSSLVVDLFDLIQQQKRHNTFQTTPKQAPKTKEKRNPNSQRTCRYMAKIEVRSDVSEDLIRESLIALSYSLPDTNLSSPDLTKSSSSVKNVTESVNTDGKEKLRSDLISISYAESPDVKDTPGRRKG